MSALSIGWPTMQLRPKISNFHLRFLPEKNHLNQHIRHTTTKSNIMNICAILKKNERYIYILLIPRNTQNIIKLNLKIDKVNHCNFSDLKKNIALVDCYNYQNWTSTSRSKYVPLKIMDEITYPLTIEVWELPLENFITHFRIHDGCSYLSMLGFKGNPCW